MIACEHVFIWSWCILYPFCMLVDVVSSFVSRKYKYFVSSYLLLCLWISLWFWLTKCFCYTVSDCKGSTDDSIIWNVDLLWKKKEKKKKKSYYKIFRSHPPQKDEQDPFWFVLSHPNNIIRRHVIFKLITWKLHAMTSKGSRTKPVSVQYTSKLYCSMLCQDMPPTCATQCFMLCV